ncbi:MAG TPA: helix-turn-helix domain-containing protein [Acidimicrobiales bacterium]
MTGTAVADGDDEFGDYRWVTPVRAAEMLGISIHQLYRRIDTGALPAYRIAEELRLLTDDVRQLRDQPPERGT